MSCLGDQRERKHGSDAFSGAQPQVEEGVKTERIEYTPVSWLSAEVPGDEVGLDLRPVKNGGKRARGSQESVQHNEAARVRHAQADPCQEDLLGAADSAEQILELRTAELSGRRKAFAHASQGLLDDVLLTGDYGCVAPHAPPYYLIGCRSEQGSGERRGDRRVAYADFAKGDGASSRKLGAHPRASGEQPRHGTALKSIRAGQVAPRACRSHVLPAPDIVAVDTAVSQAYLHARGPGHCRTLTLPSRERSCDKPGCAARERGDSRIGDRVIGADDDESSRTIACGARPDSEERVTQQPEPPGPSQQAAS